MPNKILVAYASKYGSTAQIADRISQILERGKIDVEELPVESVLNLSGYSAIVLGSAVNAGQWRPEATRFIEKQETELRARPTWLFSSGPTGKGEPVDLMNGWRIPENLQEVVEEIQPQDIAFFHGRIEMDSLSFGERVIVKALKAPSGDFRDWQAITAWSEGIAESLTDTIPQRARK